MHFNRLCGLRLLAAFTFIGTCATAIPAPYFTRPTAPTQRIFIENINLSTADFFEAYMSPNETERHYAELYLLGVLDATEGISWCSYKKLKTITIQEIIFEELKNIAPQKTNERASKIIVEILSKRHACKDGK